MKTTPDLHIFKELILAKCGLVFENNREITLGSALKQRMLASGVNGAFYYSKLQSSEKEFELLIELLTVNETYFFREPSHLIVIIDRLIPDLLKSRETRPLKIVSAGCSTGEEPYTVAIMLLEKYGVDADKLFSISGVDIDRTALTKANHGVFQKKAFRSMDENIRKKYFTLCGKDNWLLNDAVRKLVTFNVANLFDHSDTDTLQQADIILYRNVSIYFPQTVQKWIFKKLAELLREGGYLVVGAIETIHHNIGILTLVKLDFIYVYQKIQGLAYEERRKHRRTETLNPACVILDRVGQDLTNIHCKCSNIEVSSQVGRIVNPAVDESRSLFDQALSLVIDGSDQGTNPLLDTLLAGQSDFTNAHLLKGSILLNQGQYLEARTICERLLEMDPMNFKALLLHGMILRQLDCVSDAISCFRQSIYLDQECWPAHFFLAELVFTEGDNRRSKGGYESVLRILDNDSDTSGNRYFPLAFKKEQYAAVCKHKLSLIKKGVD